MSFLNGRRERCTRKGCSDIGIAKPILCLPAPPPNEREHFKVTFNLPVCRAHMSPKIRLYLSADGKQEILRAVHARGIMEPQWKKAWIEFVPVGAK